MRAYRGRVDWGPEAEVWVAESDDVPGLATGAPTVEELVENLAKGARIKATRRRCAEHIIEEVGEKLRAMMPWIAKNRLVDKAKN